MGGAELIGLCPNFLPSSARYPFQLNHPIDPSSTRVECPSRLDHCAIISTVELFICHIPGRHEPYVLGYAGSNRSLVFQLERR